jgi:hypothetical protein
MLPSGNYSYEIRLDGELIAYEDSNFDRALIVGSRRSADGRSRHKVEARLDADHHVRHVTLSYSSSLFTRKATYEAVDENLRGRVSGLAGRNEMVVALGRFREVDPAGFLIFRALIIGHICQRCEERWTGRVAVIDPNTLVPASIKQNCARRSISERSWIYEPRMGDREEIELDHEGRILRCRDNRGVSAEPIVSGRGY